MDIIRWLLLLTILVSCNSYSPSQALCDEAASLTHTQIQEQLINRKLIWHATVDDVIFTNDLMYIVFINDEHIEVQYVPQEIAMKLNKGDPFNFIGTITKFNERCFGEVQFNEPYK